MAKRAFGELENQILNTLKNKKRLTIKKEVQLLLGGQDNYNTIMEAKPHASLQRVRTILKGSRIEPSWIPCIVGTLLGMLAALSCVV